MPKLTQGHDCGQLAFVLDPKHVVTTRRFRDLLVSAIEEVAIGRSLQGLAQQGPVGFGQLPFFFEGEQVPFHFLEILAAVFQEVAIAFVGGISVRSG